VSYSASSRLPVSTHPAIARRPAAPGLKLIQISLIVLITIRFFTEVIPVVPRVANFIDIPIFLMLAFAAILRPRLADAERRDASILILFAWVFFFTCAVGTIANGARVEIAPVLVFIYGYLAPVGVFFAVYRLWPVGSSLQLSRLIVALGILQLIVVFFIDVPRFLGNNNPDEISGTFGENAYQLVFFLLVFIALIAGIFTFENQRRLARWVPLLFLLAMGTIFLAQYRALLLTTFFTLVMIAIVLGSARLRGIAIGGVVAFAFLVVLNYTADALPVLRLGGTIDVLTGDPRSIVDKRIHALDHVNQLYKDDPRYMLTGTGPGTYSSRAWQTFAGAESKSQSNVVGAYATRLTGGKPYKTDVSDKYISPRVRGAEVFEGSRALAYPYSDYTSLLAEVGILGLIAMMFIYGSALLYATRIVLATRKNPNPGDPLPALALACAAAFFIMPQMGILQSWLEVTRITFPAWILLAVVAKEYRTRYELRRLAEPEPSATLSSHSASR
jgi:hypothetical protein